MTKNIAIIGGGIGGLCLAQGLRGAGLDVTVYERDRTPGRPAGPGPAGAFAQGQGVLLTVCLLRETTSAMTVESCQASTRWTACSRPSPNSVRTTTSSRSRRPRSTGPGARSRSRGCCCSARCTGSGRTR
ncbi:FAD-dependent oxidoreductase [Nonomuraea insulae]|uniref:FAD-dependent oxidoreductase n=1 Tax=Nonomuraea insulae TaxID=1616787 RepID=A0ABW1CH75_9ACTN